MQGEWARRSCMSVCSGLQWSERASGSLLMMRCSTFLPKQTVNDEARTLSTMAACRSGAEESLLAFYQLRAADTLRRNHAQRTTGAMTLSASDRPRNHVLSSRRRLPLASAGLPSGHRGSFRWLLSSAVFPPRQDGLTLQNIPALIFKRRDSECAARASLHAINHPHICDEPWNNWAAKR